MCFGDWIFKEAEDGARIEIGRDAKSANLMILECFTEYVQV